METIIPVFPCKSLGKTLNFYRILGFEVTYQQEEPYIYASVQRGEIHLHFSSMTTWKVKNSVCLVLASQVEDYHRRFADALRTAYGSVPTADFPRITRWGNGQTRFHVFDPNGNVLIYIDQDEPDRAYPWSQEALSPLMEALENAVFLRDVYCNDQAAATVLDKALARHSSADAVERARVLAARAELAVALGDFARAQAFQDQLQQIDLAAHVREHLRDELEAAERLMRWIKHPL